jgi:hypothetical protein
MSDEQNSKSSQKKGPFVVNETKGSPPPEPVNAVPFLNERPVQKGLSPPPVEPVNISPFPAKPPKRTSNPSSSENTK